MNSGAERRIVDSGTSARFALLILLVLVTSGITMMESVYYLSAADYAICDFAAGVDPFNAPPINLGIASVSQIGPYLACLNRYDPPPAWWLPAFWPVVITATGLALFAVLPRWRIRRRRLVSAGDFDGSGELVGELEHCSAGKGLPPGLRFKVDLAKESDGAVVFGSNRHPVVCLDVDLVLRRRADPQRFRAVVLHELAHVRNGDVTLTYVAVCVWRAFLWLALPPYLVISAITIAHWAKSPEFSIETRPGFRALLLIAALGMLIYLVRADVLRSREIYADRTAQAWGARWPQEDEFTRSGRVVALFTELWRTHPNRALRRDALRDPAPLFSLPVLPLFLAGVAASLVNWDLGFALISIYRVPAVESGVPGQLTHQGAALITAAIVVGVAGTSIWRAAARASEASKPAPSGALAGLWLGTGMAAGELAVNQLSAFQLLPTHPEVLLLVVLAGAAFGWWTAQCAHVWSRAWPGRSLRQPMLISLTGGTLVMSWWFGWWEGGGGAVLTEGWPWSVSGTRQLLAQEFGGHPAAVSTVSAWFTIAQAILDDFFLLPLAPLGVAALCLTPLAGWLTAPVARALPSLWRVLLAAITGTGLCCFGIVMLHEKLAVSAGQLGDYSTRYMAGVAVAVVAASAVAAALASLFQPQAELITGLIAAELAALCGYAGACMIISRDGCASQPNGIVTCPGHAVSPWLSFHSLLVYLLEPILAVTVILAFLVTPAAAAWRNSRHAAPGPRPRPAGVAGLCALVLTVTSWTAAIETNALVKPPNYALLQQTAQRVLAAPDPAVPAKTLAEEVRAWGEVGGNGLITQIGQDVGQYTAARREQATQPSQRTWPGVRRSVYPACAALSQVALIAYDYFRVPDHVAQQSWYDVMNLAWTGGQDCEHGIENHDLGLYTSGLQLLDEVGSNYQLARTRVIAVERAGGY